MLYKISKKELLRLIQDLSPQQKAAVNGTIQYLGTVSMVPMDDWLPNVQYEKLNYVRHLNATYLAKKGSIGVEPSVTPNWQDAWMLSSYMGGANVVTVQTSILPTQWNNNVATVSAVGVTSTNYVEVSAGQGSAAAFINSDITVSGQGNDTLTFSCSVTPTETINVNLLIIS